jgi:hypothetical protein
MEEILISNNNNRSVNKTFYIKCETIAHQEITKVNF